MKPLEINNSFTHHLPEDSIKENYTRQVTDAAYSIVKPVLFKNAQIIHTTDFTQELGFTEQELQSDEFRNIFTGQHIVDNTQPYAMAYVGHQFGNWAGQLGDGRAINLFESIHNGNRWAFQLKGAGPTPYSRRGDGFAVLRSSIREHLCSEAMYYLGVQTTRSLTLSLTGEQVIRDILYDGNPAYESGAMVCRVARSFIRFGNFELFAAQGNYQLLQQLADYTIDTFYTHITLTGKHRYLQFFKEVTNRTLDMVIHWQRVGFVHGVMNTDNMSILGLTIDYGPYGWLEPYDLNWTPNTTDHQHKRYKYGSQPEIALWNLLQLANALYPIIDDGPALEEILNAYKVNYRSRHLTMMKEKLGIHSQHENDHELIAKLTHTLQLHETDMTIFFRKLSRIETSMSSNDAFVTISFAFYDIENMSDAHQWAWLEWLDNYLNRLKLESEQSDLDDFAFAKAKSQKMNRINPKYVLRNYISQLVIEAAEKGDFSLLNQVYQMIKNPYDEQPQYEKWYTLRPEWARTKVGCSMLSCSS